MTETTWAALRQRLLEGYEELTRRLARRLGSADLAREIVHETYLRLDRDGRPDPVSNPDGYIFRTAINIAKNRGVIDRRYYNASETQILADIVDDAPDPARVAQARLDAEMLQKALDLLPPRRRAIFEASWVDEIPHAELARRHGVHVRTIQREIEAATTFMRRWWKESAAGRRDFLGRLSQD